MNKRLLLLLCSLVIGTMQIYFRRKVTKLVILSALIVNPTKFTSFSANTNLSAFRVMLCSLHRSSSARTRSTCCSKLSSKTIMSSMTFLTLRKPAMAMSPRLQYSSPVEESQGTAQELVSSPGCQKCRHFLTFGR